ncbi:AAA family ATPase [Streptomyces sp. NPDC001401]|uniref:AAA family ATPase n=1 Tax=Streptomyces sp. NPDC001401 TaxID=3364570 RepID=UPI0036990FF7
MRLGISGTYSSGKTMTALALSHYTGLPRTMAKTMREILPEAAPGKTLEECTAAELLQMIVVRHTERVKYEYQLADGFISDGSSLQEWIYGALRVRVGINPNDSVHLAEGEDVERTPEIEFFDDVMRQLGVSFKQHVKRSFDAFVHLRNELPLSADGHRPVNNRFRTMADARLLEVLAELEIPVHVVGGSLAERLRTIVDITGITPVVSEAEAIAKAQEAYGRIDTTIETRRSPVLAG